VRLSRLGSEFSLAPIRYSTPTGSGVFHPSENGSGVELISREQGIRDVISMTYIGIISCPLVQKLKRNKENDIIL